MCVYVYYNIYIYQPRKILNSLQILIIHGYLSIMGDL